jgi:hypothetical protein
MLGVAERIGMRPVCIRLSYVCGTNPWEICIWVASWVRTVQAKLTTIALVLDQEQQDQGQQFVFTTNQLALRTLLFV